MSSQGFCILKKPTSFDKLNRKGQNMMNVLASIDIGTYTARLLIAKKLPSSNILRPLARQRAYIRLADGLGLSRKKIIKADAVDRTLNAMRDFLNCINRFRVDRICAVATGFFREAENNDQVIKEIYKNTGIEVRIITGEEEALLSGKGALCALDLGSTTPFLVIDLGGGSSELLIGTRDAPYAVSLPLGAAVLQHLYFKYDPPGNIQIYALRDYIDQVLASSSVADVAYEKRPVVIGTGGTIITIAALIHNVSLKPKLAFPERITGLEISSSQMETLFDHMKTLTLLERIKSYGLERDRAKVILAGIFIVMRLMHFFGSARLITSFSDLLEGLLLSADRTSVV